MQRFLDLFPEADDDGSTVTFAYLRQAAVDDDGDTVVLTVHSTDREWIIRCAGIQAERSGPNYRLQVDESALEFSSAAIHVDHPLLWPWNRPYYQVFFGPLTFHAALVVDLLAAHEALVGSYFSFLRFMNASSLTQLLHLLSSGSACLATAPSPLAAAYAEVLSRHGGHPFLSDLTGQAIRGPSEQQAGSRYKLLQLGVSSYVIAESFTLEIRTPGAGPNPSLQRTRSARR